MCVHWLMCVCGHCLWKSDDTMGLVLTIHLFETGSLLCCVLLAGTWSFGNCPVSTVRFTIGAPGLQMSYPAWFLWFQGLKFETLCFHASTSLPTSHRPVLRLIFKVNSKSQCSHLDGLGFKCGWQHVGKELHNYRQQEFHEGHHHEHQEGH